MPKKNADPLFTALFFDDNKFMVRVHIFCPLLCLFFSFAATPLLAVEQIAAPRADGRPFFVFDIYQYGEQSPWESVGTPPSDWPLSSAIKQSITEAADYWVRILSPGARNTGPLTISVSSLDEDNAYAYSPPVSGGYTALQRPIITGEADDRPLATIVIGDTDYLNTYETGPVRVLPANGDRENLQSGTVLHELGHALGIGSSLTDVSLYKVVPDELSLYDKYLYNEDGQQYTPGQTITWDKDSADPDDFLVAAEKDEDGRVWGGALYFRGDNTLTVLNGATLLNNQTGLPINAWEPMIEDENGQWISGLDASHIELRNSLMSHQEYRNYGIFMEAELALMQDIGYDLDRKSFFGSSEYRDGQTYNNTNGYFARRNGRYLPGVANTAPLGIGFHLYGCENTITQTADLLADGWGGVGVRIDGWENNFTIAQGTRITANGAEGTGLMAAYGHGHQISSQGDITALGPNGVAARFDFGSNVLSYTENCGSYIHEYYYSNDDGWWVEGWDDYGREGSPQKLSEVNGPLADNFDVTGTLAGDAAAIYISENAYVKNINIMRGTQLFGDIISYWDPYSRMIDSSINNRDELVTALNFGLTPDAAGKSTAAADANFFLDYRGNITGTESVNVKLAGGTLAYTGNMDVLSFTAETGTALMLPLSGARIAAPDIDFKTGSRVGLTAGSISYGAPIPDQYELLRLEGENVNWEATVEHLPQNFIHGFHDYTSSSLTWDAAGASLKMGSSRRLSGERAAESALTAPTVIAMQTPYTDLLRRRALFRFDEPAGSRSLWASSTLGHSQRGGNYSLNAPGVALGVDRTGRAVLGQNAVLGAGAYFSSPVYRSDHADVDAESNAAFVYGSVLSSDWLQFDAFAALGRSEFEQRRSVHGEHYETDYSGNSFHSGIALNKLMPLRPGRAVIPFANYTFTHVNTRGYNEGALGLFGLEVGRSRSDLHRFEAGSAFLLSLEKEDSSLYRNRDRMSYAEARIFYSGLGGDRASCADVTMVRDSSGYRLRSSGFTQDEHSLGLGLNVNWDLSDWTRFSAGYTFIGGRWIKHHQAEMNFSFAF